MTDKLTLATLREQLKARYEALGLHWDCLSDGDVSGEIAFVSEAPGQREKETKIPLIGGSGTMLWTCCRRYNISRTRAYVTNTIKRQLLTEHGKTNISAAEADLWQSLLRWELLQLPNLKYVVVLGNQALQALTGETGIIKWRGSVLPTNMEHVLHGPDGSVQTASKPVTVIALYNPAFVLREPKNELIFRHDVKRINDVITGVYKPHDVTCHINPSPAEALSWIDKMHDDKLPVAFDIETVSKHTACIGFGNNSNEAMCINFRDQTTNRFCVEDERELRKRIARLLGDPEVKLVAQNGSYDCINLWYRDKIKVHHVWYDTMLAHHTLYSTLPHSLAFLVSQYTAHPYYKDEGTDWKEGGNIDQYWTYNCKDVALTRAVQIATHNELRKQGMERFFFEEVMALQPTLVRMAVGGVKCDVAAKAAISERLRQETQTLKEEFQRKVRIATGGVLHEVNPDSPKQLQALFFGHLRLTGRGKSTDEDNRERMFHHARTSDAAKDVLTTLGQYKEEKKFYSTYAEMRIGPDNRFRTEYKQMGTTKAPGRLSSAQPLGIDHGGNLQNIPQRAYEMFIADRGYVLVYFDLEQAEARFVAYEARIPKWIEQFERARLDGSYDCHRALASEMWGLPYDEVPVLDRDSDGRPTLRYIAKRCRHGLNYRMGVDRLATVTGLSSSEAARAYELYHRTTPELRAWWKSIEQEVRKSRQLFTPLGRRLVILERITPEALESIVAFKPQATIGDWVKRCMHRCENDEAWPDNARMLLNLHDALIALVPEKSAVQALRVMKWHAERPLYIHGEQLIIPASCKISHLDERGVHRWSTLKGIEVEPMKRAA